MTSETTAKKNVQKLQRAIVDGLEDVKAQDIQVFNTEHLSSLFERVIVASGTSNRQTKALAASVRDAVREAGFDKPRTEGEDNGEWIIVDCGPAVVHVMQPSIRQYYRLEEIWGDKPVRLKHAAANKVATAPSAPVAPTKAKAPAKAPAKQPAKTAAKPVAKAAPRKTAATKTAATTQATAKPKAPARKSVAAAPVPKLVVKAKAPATQKTTAKATPKAAPKPAAKAPAKSAANPAAKAAPRARKPAAKKPA
ncbi:MAG: ribosome silencing factor [Pseudomonadota bacterium]